MNNARKFQIDFYELIYKKCCLEQELRKVSKKLVGMYEQINEAAK